MSPTLRLGAKSSAICLLLGFAAACSGASNPPNVLLITVDTLRPDFLGAYGSPINASPNLDALARESVVFERAIAASPRTAPSHATIMTSLWVREHSIGWVNGASRLDGEWTIADVFSSAGYDTAAFVGNMQLSKRIGLDAGFAIYDDDLRDHEANRPDHVERTAENTTRRALHWLSRERDRPWFLWVHYQDPHGPYTPPTAHASKFDLREESEQPLPVLAQNRGEFGIPAYQELPGLRYPGEYASRYAGEVHFFDHWLGQLLEAVDTDPRQSAVLFTADHGESFGEDGWWFSHGFRTTPDQIHVPFLLRAPALEPQRRRELVHHVDVAPTLIDLAGLPLPEPNRGLALARLLAEKKPLPDRMVYSDVGFEATAYQGDSFMRTTIEESGEASTIDPHTFRWSSTRDWVSEAKSLPLEGFIAYLSIPPNLVAAEALSSSAQEERLRQLRALGYVEAGEDEEKPPDAQR